MSAMKEQVRNFFGKSDVHHQIYVFLLVLFVIFLPTSKYMTSLIQFLLAIHWLIRGGLKSRLLKLFKSPALVIFLVLFMWHVFGLFYSSDLEYGIHDLKIKLPLLILPLVIGTSEKVSPGELRAILLFFVAAVFTSSVVSVLAIVGWIPMTLKDFRDASLFISHIRFALLVDMSIFILTFYALRPQTSKKERGVYFLFALYFIGFLILSKALTGIVVALLVGTLLALRWILTKKSLMARWFALVGVLTIPILVTTYIGSESAKFYTIKDDLTQLDPFTIQGNVYWHDTTNLLLENGHFVGLYWCEKELMEAWKERSSFSYQGDDLRGQELRYTLIRYLTSLGYRKDAAGVSRLTPEDISLIENGFANVIYRDKNNFHNRMYQLIWQVDVYRKGGNPSGHSLTQRMEYFKTGWAIFQEKPYFGVGSGDVPAAFVKKYIEIDSQLEPKWQLRAHNQWLTFAIAFGIVGLVIMLLAFFLPGLLLKAYSQYLFLLFILVAFISMFNEDTLETQAGVAFIAFFYPLFLYSIPDEKRI